MRADQRMQAGARTLEDLFGQHVGKHPAGHDGDKQHCVPPMPANGEHDEQRCDGRGQHRVVGRMEPKHGLRHGIRMHRADGIHPLRIERLDGSRYESASLHVSLSLRDTRSQPILKGA